MPFQHFKSKRLYFVWLEALPTVASMSEKHFPGVPLSAFQSPAHLSPSTFCLCHVHSVLKLCLPVSHAHVLTYSNTYYFITNYSLLPVFSLFFKSIEFLKIGTSGKLYYLWISIVERVEWNIYLKFGSDRFDHHWLKGILEGSLLTSHRPHDNVLCPRQRLCYLSRGLLGGWYPLAEPIPF